METEKTYLNEEDYNKMSILGNKEKYDLIENLILNSDTRITSWCSTITEHKKNIQILKKDIKKINQLKKDLNEYIEYKNIEIKTENKNIERLRNKN